MAADPQNKQYDNPPFSMSTGIASTGAPGSQPTAGMADTATAPVTIPVSNYQFEGHGGTAFTAQLHEGFSGQGPDAIASTGAGKGSGHDPHPNAG